MVLRLNRLSYEYAQKLIKNRQCVIDERDQWHDHRPSRTAENRVIEEHGLAEYGKWHLGEDDEEAEKSKRRYKFPYGDLQKVHRCAVLAAQSRAGQYKHADIEMAAAHLHAMLDALMPGRSAKEEHDHANST